MEEARAARVGAKAPRAVAGMAGGAGKVMEAVGVGSTLQRGSQKSALRSQHGQA